MSSTRVLLGRHAVREALRAARLQVHAVYVLAGEPPGDIADLARQRGVSVEDRHRDQLTAMAGSDRHQGVVAVAGDFAYAEPEALVEQARQAGQTPLLVALDGIQDPQNLGAIVRSASFFGAHGVIVPRDRAAPVTGATVRASAGATERMPIARCTNLVRTLDACKEAGLWIVGAAVEGGRAPSTIDLCDPIVLVIGSEGKGLRPLVARTCDHMATLPGAGGVAALNASAAAAVLLYEARRQRGARSPST